MMSAQGWRRFVIDRRRDPTGVSGTGTVAQGMVFHTGQVVVCWFGAHATVTVHPSIESVRAVHLHGGDSAIRWIDPICFACGAVLEYHEIAARHCLECGAGQGDELHFADDPDSSLGAWSLAMVIPAQANQSATCGFAADEKCT